MFMVNKDYQWSSYGGNRSRFIVIL